MGQRPGSVTQFVTAVLALAVTAVLAVVAHQATWGERRWPVGVVLAVALTASVASALRAWGVGTAARVTSLVAWLAVTFVAAAQRPEGDVLVPGNGRGYAFLLAGFAVLVVALTAPGGRAARARG